MNYSKQRNLILEIIKNTQSHPTAEWVYQEAKKVMPGIGIATVYRNLNALAEMGECRRLTGGDGQDRFDGDVHTHFHMKCSCCGGLTDLMPGNGENLSRLQEMVKDTFCGVDPDVELSTVLLSGICEACRVKN